MNDSFLAAVQNVARHGDTDVFPYPIENHIFYDREGEVVRVLEKIHLDLPKAIAENPPLTEGMLAAVGYNGFRWATQLDPIWNAYFLALVIDCGPRIEAARLPVERGNVFSYRYAFDATEKTLFDKNIGWLQYQKASVQRAQEANYVLSCDISDFYPRIYHHRLENALHKAVADKGSCNRIMSLLRQFSNNVSYGLPVGGPAARLLSELLLNRVDRLLVSSKVDFCRFADDYHIFADSEETAYRYLLLLSEKLQDNEGLLLQKSKTRVMSSDEFLATSDFTERHDANESSENIPVREFLRMRLHFDPYSPTAQDDYEDLREQIAKFDILGMLGREMRKSRVHQGLSRKLIGAVRFLEQSQRDGVLLSLVKNLSVLYPVFTSVMLLLKNLIDELEAKTREEILREIRSLIATNSYIVQVPTHLAYCVRVLSYDRSVEADELLASIYEKVNKSAIRRDIILAMARRNADFWVSDVRRRFTALTSWEQTGLLVASFTLGDEGDHWRKLIKGRLSPMQTVALEWAADRAKVGKTIPL